MEVDPFDVPAFSVPTRLDIKLSRNHEPDLFFDGDRFLAYLNASYDEFDIITYSQSKSAKAPIRRVRRLIYGLKQYGCVTRSSAKKHCLNIHVKMFICYRQGYSADVFIGSQNLTHATNLNIMYKVRQEHVQSMLEFFNNLWEKL